MIDEELVPTVKTCLLLKETGFIQDTMLCFWKTEPNSQWRLNIWDSMQYERQRPEKYTLVAAPTLQESMEYLRVGLDVFVENGVSGWVVGTYEDNRDRTCTQIHNYNLAEAAALLWLRLQKEKKL